MCTYTDRNNFVIIVDITKNSDNKTIKSIDFEHGTYFGGPTISCYNGVQYKQNNKKCCIALELSLSV